MEERFADDDCVGPSLLLCSRTNHPACTRGRLFRRQGSPADPLLQRWVRQSAAEGIAADCLPVRTTSSAGEVARCPKD